MIDLLFWLFVGFNYGLSAKALILGTYPAWWAILDVMNAAVIVHWLRRS